MTSLLFFRGHGLADALVRDIEQGAFAHVACRINDSEVIEAVIPVVRLRAYNPDTLDKGAVEVPHTLNVDWLRAQVGKPYDVEALEADLASDALGGGLHLYDSQQGRWDCSRLAAVAAGLNTLGERGPVTPQRLYDLVTAKEIYE